MPGTNDTLQTRNPNPDAEGTRIDAAKYEAVRAAILRAVPEEEEGILFKDLPRAMADLLPGREIPGGGSTTWYCTVVKLDLEARGLIERVPGARPQRLRRPVDPQS